MEKPKKKRIKLPLEIDIHKRNHEEGYEQCYMNLLDSNDLPYDVLRIIFGYLNSRDLQNVAMVCRFWLKAANDEKYSRGPYIIELSYNSNNKRCTCKSRLCVDCIIHKIRDLNIEPAGGILLSSIPNSSYYIRDINNKLLPKNCKIIALHVANVILSKHHNYKYILQDKVICALFPQVCNIKINTLKITEITDNKSKRKKYTEYITIIEHALMQDHKMATCIMIFCHSDIRTMALKLYSKAKMRFGSNDNNTIFFCDVLENGICPIDIGPSCVVAVSITGFIRTWSIVIDWKNKTRQQIEEKLKLFKEKIDLQKHSVGFIFGRDTKDHVKNLEKVEAFNRLFPKVPLAGCLSEQAIPCCSVIWSVCNHSDTDNVTYIILTYGSVIEGTL